MRAGLWATAGRAVFRAESPAPAWCTRPSGRCPNVARSRVPLCGCWPVLGSRHMPRRSQSSWPKATSLFLWWTKWRSYQEGENIPQPSAEPGSTANPGHDSRWSHDTAGSVVQGFHSSKPCATGRLALVRRYSRKSVSKTRHWPPTLVASNSVRLISLRTVYSDVFSCRATFVIDSALWGIKNGFPQRSASATCLSLVYLPGDVN